MKIRMKTGMMEARQTWLPDFRGISEVSTGSR